MSDKVWVASYPRSGSTLCRTILFNCFWQQTWSKYGGEFQMLPQFSAISRVVGERHDARFVKTHEIEPDGLDAILVVRHPVSLAESCSDFGRGDMFGVAWHDFWGKWLSSDRRLLVLRYEDMVENLACALSQIHEFTGLPTLSKTIPERDDVADGWMIRKSNQPRKWVMPVAEASAMLLEHSSLLRRLGYD